MSAEPFGRDASTANRASIALLIEVNGRRLLFPGDSHADALTKAVRRECERQGVRRLYVDLCVLPHNGSRRNITPDLLNLLDVRIFAVSTDGKAFHHPDVETIDLIRQTHPNAQISFNYAEPALRVIDELGLVSAAQGLLLYPAVAEPGLEISLE